MPFGCKEHLEHVIDHAIAHSNINQVKVRILDPEVATHHCEVCDKVAYYHAVAIKFGE